MSGALDAAHDEEDLVEDHEDYGPSGSKPDHKCPWCPKIFPDGTSLKNHIGGHHAAHSPHPESKKREGSGRLLCAKPGCNEMLLSYDALGRHCVDEHGVVLNHHNARFDNVEEFRDWLAHLASVTGSMVKRRGERKTADGITMGDYHCIFDGKKRETASVRRPDRNPYTRRVPSKKLGFSCPAIVRYQVNIDGSVIIRSQLSHFGHDLTPADMSIKSPRIAMGRRKNRRMGYGFDGVNYDEINSMHMNELEEDRIEMDDQGMVNLFEFPSLERASFHAQSSIASMELALAEVQSIPHENLPRMGILIEKLHEIAASASIIESLVKDLAVAPEQPLIYDNSAKHKMHRGGRYLARKRTLHSHVKEEEDDESEKRPRLEENGSHEEEGFEHQSESGEMVYHEDPVAEEIVVDDGGEYAEETEEREERSGEISGKNGK